MTTENRDMPSLDRLRGGPHALGEAIADGEAASRSRSIRRNRLQPVLADLSTVDLIPDDLAFLDQRTGWSERNEHDLVAILRTTDLFPLKSGVPAVSVYDSCRTGIPDLGGDIPPLDGAERREQFVRARLDHLGSLDRLVLDTALRRAVEDRSIPSNTNARTW